MQSIASANCEPYPRSLPVLWRSPRFFSRLLLPGSCVLVWPIVVEYYVFGQAPPGLCALLGLSSTPLVSALFASLLFFPFSSHSTTYLFQPQCTRFIEEANLVVTKLSR